MSTLYTLKFLFFTMKEKKGSELCTLHHYEVLSCSHRTIMMCSVVHSKNQWFFHLCTLQKHEVFMCAQCKTLKFSMCTLQKYDWLSWAQFSLMQFSILYSAKLIACHTKKGVIYLPPCRLGIYASLLP